MSNGISYNNGNLTITVEGQQILTASSAGIYVSGGLNIDGQAVTPSGGTTTLQDAYNNSSPATIELADAKTFTISPAPNAYTSVEIRPSANSTFEVTDGGLDLGTGLGGGYFNIYSAYTLNLSSDSNTTVQTYNGYLGLYSNDYVDINGRQYVEINSYYYPSSYVKFNTNYTLFTGSIYISGSEIKIENGTLNTKDVAVSGTLNTAAQNVWNKPQIGAITSLTSVSNTASIDLSLSNNFKFDINEDCVLDNPTNIIEGQSGVIIINQPPSTNYTMSYGTFWKFASGSSNILTVNSGAIDVLSYYVASSSYAICNLVKDFA